MDEGSKPAEIVNPIEKPIERMDEKSIGHMGLKKPEKSSKNIAKIILYAVIGLAVIAGSVGAGYMWRDITANDTKKSQDSKISTLENTKTTLEKQLADEKAKYDALIANGGTQPITPCTSIAPSATAIDNIKASITSGNTAALVGYSAATVTRVFVSSAGVMTTTPATTVPSVTEFITDDNTSWDYEFSLPAATLTTYRNSTTYGKYFPTIAVVGKATNKKVISFSFDCTGKIDTIFMADNADII
jgi:hypothetical protein